MYLNASTDKIEIVLGGTVATNQLQWNVSYQDITSSGMTLPQSGGAGLTNNATAVDIVAAPAASTTRQVTQINVYNADTATATVIIQKDVSGTNYVLFRYNITSLDTLSWSREDGWRLVSQAGGVNSLTSNNFLIGDAGNIAVQAPLSGDVTNVIGAVTIANDAVTYAKMQNVSAASRLLGRGSAGGAGDVEEITLGSGLSMTGTSLSATGAAYTFSTGLTDTSGTVTANLSTGVAGGQSIIGGTAASNNLTLSSTSNATKGKILFGTSAYDEVNNSLGIGTQSPLAANHIVGDVTSGTGEIFLDRFTLANAPTFTFRKANGTIAVPSSVLSGDNLGVIGWRGYAAGAFSTGPRSGISSNSSQNWTGAAQGCYLGFFTTPNGSTTIAERMRIFDSGNVFIGLSPTDAGFRLDVNGTARFQGRVTVNQDTTVTTQTVSVITSGTTNAGLVLAPNGTGAIMAQAPDGGTGGGNARGTNAVDFQMTRSANTMVASGTNSFVGSGFGNTANSSGCVVVGGGDNLSNNFYSVIVAGRDNVSSSSLTFVGAGRYNSATGAYSQIAGGENTLAYLYGQNSRASGSFGGTSVRGDAQTSAITYRRSITGTAQAELFLDGASTRAILNISSPGPTNARAWRAQVDVVAIVQTAGTGTLVLGECFMGSYHVGIKRIGATTSLVGTVSVTNEVSDTNMATSVVTIDADNTNEALRIQFTPPTGGTSSATSVIRVVATAYLTEVGY